MPAAERIESLPGHRGGACGSAGAQVDSIVGKFLHELPRDDRHRPGQKTLRGELTLNVEEKMNSTPTSHEPLGLVLTGPLS